GGRRHRRRGGGAEGKKQASGGHQQQGGNPQPGQLAVAVRWARRQGGVVVEQFQKAVANGLFQAVEFAVAGGGGQGQPVLAMAGLLAQALGIDVPVPLGLQAQPQFPQQIGDHAVGKGFFFLNHGRLSTLTLGGGSIGSQGCSSVTAESQQTAGGAEPTKGLGSVGDGQAQAAGRQGGGAGKAHHQGGQLVPGLAAGHALAGPVHQPGLAQQHPQVG